MTVQPQSLKCPRCGAFVTESVTAGAQLGCRYCGTQLVVPQVACREVELLGLVAERAAGPPLKSALERCLHAVSKTETGPFGCAQLHFAGQTLDVAATDGHRLAFCKQPFALSRPRPPLLLPRRAVERLLEELAMNPAELELAFGDDRLFARVAGRALSFVYGSGSLSNLGNAVPRSVLASTTVPVDALLVALGEGATKGVLHTRADQLLVSVGGREGFLLFPVTGQPLTIHFNPSFLSESVRACHCPRVRLSFAGPAAPIVVQPAEPNGYMGLVMPLRPPP